jgi:hypothetical protein
MTSKVPSIDSGEEKHGMNGMGNKLEKWQLNYDV